MQISLLIILIVLWNFAHHNFAQTCFGTSNGVNNVKRSDREPYMQTLKRMYENCTIIHGNLELVHLEIEDLLKANMSSLDFLSSIEQITGYMLIANNKLMQLSLPKLKIIWGDDTFKLNQKAEGPLKEHSYGLLIYNNALLNIYMPSFRAINNGNLGFMENRYMCTWKTLDYKQFFGDDYENRTAIMNNHEKCRPDEFKCDSSCNHCFGPSAEACQKVYRDDCAPQCSSGMCFNKTLPQYCCHPECIGGCYGPTDKDCIACQKMRNDDRCVDRCPSKHVYNTHLAIIQENPQGRYAYNRECVDECPSFMRVYKDGCVARCPDGFYEKNSECVECQGQCPKTCTITDSVTSANIKDFINCTKVEGFIMIRKDTFEDSALYTDTGVIKTKALKPEDLEVMTSVQFVTDYVFIQSTIHNLRSLKFLRNLQKVEGRRLLVSHNHASFVIGGNDNLEELALVSLKEISNGNVFISKNQELCCVDKLPWNNLITNNRTRVETNRDPALCARENKVCHSACNESMGCWGPGSDMCFECDRWKLNNQCVETCSTTSGFYIAGPKICEFCHPECLTCSGKGPRQCTKCRNVNMNGECIKDCPSHTHYEDHATRTCHKCHSNCQEHGCSGPGNYVGPGGCNKCDYTLVDENEKIVQCLEMISSDKPCTSILNKSDYYWGAPMNSFTVKGVCAKCHPTCKSCTSFGREEKSHGCVCLKARIFKDEGSPVECDDSCPDENYYNKTSALATAKFECRRCHQFCQKCYGSGFGNCVTCKEAKILSADGKSFNCTDKCPDHLPYIDESGACTNVDKQMLLDKEARRQQAIIGIVTATVFLLLIIVCIIAFVLRRRTLILSKLSPPDENFEMNLDAKPNLSQLRIILEFELKISPKPLGTGAFGIVYKGMWQPQHEKLKVPVAIKQLHDFHESSPITNQRDMLEEAALMARMNHPNLLRLIGVCFGSRMMLITPLMYSGNLLDYVQKNREKIGSTNLLRWCTQIAAGMEHLEKHRMVHRDLAARNVLLKDIHNVRITDFGLAKLLEYGEEALKISEGKLPIKWLAIECIGSRLFTHKSDVWAFGVTCWELFTFGEKPYKDVPLKDIHSLLLYGKRLPQPSICTLDMYCILTGCWLAEPNARPSFAQLHETFQAKLKDPGLYLVVEGDKLLRLPTCTSDQQDDLSRDLVDDLELPDDNQLFLDDVQTPTFPVSPSKPLLNDNNNRTPMHNHHVTHRNQSTSSHRYASDPVRIKGITDLDLSSVPIVDVENYLMPDSKLNKHSTSLPSCEAYTPVINNNGSPGLTRVYYNDLPLSQNETDFIDLDCSKQTTVSTMSTSNDSCTTASNLEYTLSSCDDQGSTVIYRLPQNYKKKHQHKMMTPCDQNNGDPHNNNDTRCEIVQSETVV